MEYRLLREVRERWRRGDIDLAEGWSDWRGGRGARRRQWEKCATMARMYFLRGMSVTGIAREMGCSRQNVSKALCRYLRALHKAGFVTGRQDILARLFFTAGTDD